MSKPTKTELAKYKQVLEKQLSSLRGDVGSMRDEALRASEQDASVDHLADQGTDNYDQGFMLGLIENEEETIKLIEEALDRVDGNGEWEYGVCPLCQEEIENAKKPKEGKKPKKSSKTCMRSCKAAREKCSPARYHPAKRLRWMR